MVIIDNCKQKIDSDRPVSVAIGFFDGVHIGHKELLDKLMSEKGCHAVITFSNSPREQVQNIRQQYIFSTETKVSILEDIGIDHLIMPVFDESIRDMTCEEFIKSFIIDNNIKKVIIGFDFTFGKGAGGDAGTMLKLLPEDISCEVIPEVMYDGESVSSTLIKEKLINGDIKRANVLLGRYFFVSGEVVHGKHLGHELGFPTANIEIEEQQALPCWGVYMTRTTVDGTMYPSVTNIGNNPTVNGAGVSVETNIIGLESDDIYGKRLKVEFIDRIRDQIKFDDTDQLISQIGSDREYVKVHYDEV